MGLVAWARCSPSAMQTAQVFIFETGSLERLADGRVDERRQFDAAPGVREADQIAEERCVDPFPALVGGDARELEQLVDVGL